MKKIICALLSIIMLLYLAGCSEKNSEGKITSENPKTKSETKIDVDLTVLSSTMVYSEVYNMMSNPQNYIGKNVKMKGNFSVYHDEITDAYYFACLISDATACCSQGIEFVLSGDFEYPNDYPPLNTEITVKGIFGTYKEGEATYCRLSDAKMYV